MERIVELNRGPFVGARPSPQELAAPPDGAQLLDVRPVDGLLGGHRPGAINVPVSGSRFSTKAAFVLDAGGPSSCRRRRGRGGARDPRAPLGRRSSTSPGYVLGGGPERIELVSIDELDELLAAAPS